MFLISSTSAFALTISETQKDYYYAQYLKIAEEINASGEGLDVGVIPWNEISEEDWITPEEFRKLAEDMAKTVCVVSI